MVMAPMLLGLLQAAVADGHPPGPTRWRVLWNAATCSLQHRTRAQQGLLARATRPLAEGLGFLKVVVKRQTRQTAMMRSSLRLCAVQKN